MMKKALLIFALLGGGIAADAMPGGFFDQAGGLGGQAELWGPIRVVAESLDRLWRHVADSLDRAVRDSIAESKTHEVLKKPGDYADEASRGQALADRLAAAGNGGGAR